MGSSPPLASNVSVAFYTQQDLQNNPTVTNELYELINAAFQIYSETVGFHKKEPRFSHPDGLLEMLGPNGLFAAASIDNRIVASGSFIPWRPTPGGSTDQALARDRPDDYAFVEKGHPSYEVKAVVTLQSPATSRRGLAGMLVEALLRQVNEKHPGQDVLLWVQIAEAQAGPYWRRRGYERVGEVEIRPKGTWGADMPFEFLTLVKRVKHGGVGQNGEL